MNRNRFVRWAVVLHCCCAVVMGAKAAEPATIQLSGPDWRIHEDAQGTGLQDRLFAADSTAPGWIPATVPGNIQADLESAHQLNPLWYGAGDPRLEQVVNKDWWYRKDFVIPAAQVGKRFTLVFDGVEKEAEIWLNGCSVGVHTGMFERFWFDVSAAAKPGATNQLAVRLTRRPHDWDGGNIWRSPMNKPWDFSVPMLTLGIWKDVRLEATGPARIDWTRVQTVLSDDFQKATVRVILDIDSLADVPARVNCQITGQGKPVETTVSVALTKGVNHVAAELPLQKPALWWPNGQGAQPLYTLRAEACSDVGLLMDQHSTRFGVRDVRWVHTQDAPTNFINRFQLVINGRPVRTFGSCLPPTDPLFGRMLPRGLNALQHAQAAGMNTLRIWGGGVIPHEAFYDRADELGIMLIQEFPLANHLPPTNTEYLVMLERTARDIVRQVRNHPALIEMDGGNEMLWKSDTDHPAFLLLKRVVAEESGHMFRATCPDLGSGHGPWDFDLWTDCRRYNRTDAITAGLATKTPLPTMRQGEFGCGSPGNLEVWQREIPPREQWPISLESAALVRKHVVGTFGRAHWLRKNVLEDEFGPFESLPELIEAGQFHGAEALRYAIDALRRNGRYTAGMTTWDFKEPVPNGAGSYMIDYDGRPLMNYDFIKQAYAPLSLSLKYESIFYDLDKGIQAELFLTSDAPQPAENLHWKWTARDRRGTVFARQAGTTSIRPLEVQALGKLELTPPAKTVFGPIYVELRLEDAVGKLVSERMHIFGLGNLVWPLHQLVKSNAVDADDDARVVPAAVERPSDPGNVARLCLAASMTPPPVTPWNKGPPKIWRELRINDAHYGDDHGWSDGWFTIKLFRQEKIGRFRFGRDRTGVCDDHCADYLKIEASRDGETWQTVFVQDQLTKLPGFSPSKTVEIQTAPVEAAYVKVTVMPPGSDGKGPFPVIDEFEVYAPATNAPAGLPHVVVLDRVEVWRPTRHTTLQVTAAPLRVENGQEVLDLVVKNTGPMTAFPCEAHPLISYRTDLFIDNNHCFIPPGESRMITIRGPRSEVRGPKSESGGQTAEELTLAQTGWWISCWNAGRVEVAPSQDVLLAVGRRDQMCREFRQTKGGIQNSGARIQELEGSRPDPAKLPCLVDSGSTATFEFPVSRVLAKRPARLRIHTADQSKEVRAVVAVTVNGKSFEQTLPAGLGIQNTDPAHLAFPATAEFVIPAGVLQRGRNVVTVQVKTNGWFTWDALDCVSGR